MQHTHSTPLFTALLVLTGQGALAQEAPSNDRQAIAPRSVDELETHRTLELCHLGVTVEETKVLSPETAEILPRAVDVSGKDVDVSRLLREDAATRSASPASKLHRDLAAALEETGEAALPVVLWLAFDGDAIDRRAAALDAALPEEPTPEQLDEVEAQMGGFVAQSVELAAQPVLLELANLGIDVRYASTSAPAVFVDATPTELLTLAASPLIDTLYLEKDAEQDTNNVANSTHRANVTFNQGFRGAGRRVAVLEDNGIDPGNPWLDVAEWYNPLFANPDDHVNGTSGCIASDLSTRRGGAPDVSLYSANAFGYADLFVTWAADWIATRNIDVTNMSFGGNYNGTLQYKDRFFDFHSRYYTDSYVASAGNSGGSVGSPGTAWNCITVGSFDDFDTTSWSGDAMSGFSAWRNPTTGCEKPNLAAVGGVVDTLGMAPDYLRSNYSGTSFAAPFVTAALAVTMTRDASARYSPEAAMAAIMATAWHNIEGSSRLSSRDGAGGLHQRAASNAGGANKIRYVYLNRSSFSRNGYYTYNAYLTGGDRARVAIAWSSNATSNYTSDVLRADLDLAVIRGFNQTSGTAYGFSSSFNNNFEIVEFTPPSTGWYTIRINDYRFDGPSERVGIAWSQRTADRGN